MSEKAKLLAERCVRMGIMLPPTKTDRLYHFTHHVATALTAITIAAEGDTRILQRFLDVYAMGLLSPESATSKEAINQIVISALESQDYKILALFFADSIYQVDSSTFRDDHQ